MLQLIRPLSRVSARSGSEASATLHDFHGGIHPDQNKTTSEEPIELLKPPPLLYIPLLQHAGAPSRSLVSVGDHVLKGTLLADALDNVSAPVHASTSGKILSIGTHLAPHPSGLECPVIVLEADGKDTWIPSNPPADPMALSPKEIAELVERAGVVGLGGAVFPAAVKLREAAGKVHTLIINAAECEPYLTCDDRVMRERALGVVDGTRLILHALGAERALIGIEDNKPEAAEILKHAARRFTNIQVVVVPTRFPTGSGKQLVRILTGKEVPANGRSYDVGVILHNVSTAFAVHRAVRRGRPLVSRVVTVAGGAVRNPKNLDVPLGSTVEYVLDACGGLIAPPARLIMGGPMTGVALAGTQAPVVKSTTGILALTREEVGMQPEEPCIRCGRCVEACPMGLVPLEMAASTRVGQWDTAKEFGLSDCIECGSCAFVCPSRIPLVSYFLYGKGELRAQSQEKRRMSDLKKRAEVRRERLEREKAAKAEAAKARAAARKASRAGGTSSSTPPADE